MTHLATILSSLGISVAVLVGGMFKTGQWIIKTLTERMDERVNDRVQANLAPLMQMIVTLNGEPGDDERGIPARPGILQRQTVTAKQVVTLTASLATLQTQGDTTATDVSALRRILTELASSLTTNNGGSTLLDKLERAAGGRNNALTT